MLEDIRAGTMNEADTCRAHVLLRAEDPTLQEKTVRGCVGLATKSDVDVVCIG